MKIQFIGAVRSVTGSMHLVEVNGFRLLLECGLFQGRRQEAYERNRTLPFDCSTIDAMVLSHAHIDHSGNIPNLVRNGFTGNIYATPATRELCSAMLRDSAYIQEQDAKYVNKWNKRKGKPPVTPIYTVADALKSLPHFVGLNYNRPMQIGPGITLRFRDAGHILGSAFVVLDIEEEGRTNRLMFTGDVGRKHLPILRRLPIFVDSPLAVNVTEIFRMHPECFDQEINDFISSGHKDPFGFYGLRYIRYVEDSKELNFLDEPAIIISASGMAEAGRILHHLKNNIENPRNRVLIVGFQAEHTLGRRIVERRPEVKIFGEPYQLRARVEIINGYSAHADKNELHDYVQSIQSERLKNVFLIHGEEEAALAFASDLRQMGGFDVSVPAPMEVVQL